MILDTIYKCKQFMCTLRNKSLYLFIRCLNNIIFHQHQEGGEERVQVQPQEQELELEQGLELEQELVLEQVLQCMYQD